MQAESPTLGFPPAELRFYLVNIKKLLGKKIKEENWYSNQPNIIEITDSTTISDNALDLICTNDIEKSEIKTLIDNFRNAKCFGFPK